MVFLSAMVVPPCRIIINITKAKSIRVVRVWGRCGRGLLLGRFEVLAASDETVQFIHYRSTATIMPKGLKETSGLITIGSTVTESAANTFTQAEVDLQLDPLNNEVFIVYALDLNVTPPDAIAATNTITRGSVSSTSRTTIGGIADTNVMGEAADFIQAAGFVDGGVAFSRMSGETPTGDLPYLGIIATNQFFLQVEGTNNAAPKVLQAKIFGARARADASIYSALVQSELLSSN